MSTSRRASKKGERTSPPGEEPRFGKSRKNSDSGERFELILEPAAKRDLKKLERTDRSVATRVSRKLLSVEDHPCPLELAKPLTNVTAGTHRFRIGPYRATFEIHGRTIYITRIVHRREVYR